MIKKVTTDLEENRYNTAIAAMMQCVNALYKIKESHAIDKSSAWREALEAVVACIAPFAPHIADELWHQLGHSTSVHRDTWPKFDERYLATDKITIAVQVNGKLRGELSVAATSGEAEVIAQAAALDRVTAHTKGKQVIKTIYVPGKIVNIVVR